ncbi:hypothetical protein [Wolbachia endosymbiont of Zygogramma bicolorata]|uniref:hypothetical protein n=1 Tax=Wolbachia endosymbiont of Zygogramma bicolorata TaxID=3134048 RepID=UPI003DA95174
MNGYKIPSKSYDCLVLYSFSQSVNGYGERFVERMLSIFLTSRLNGQNPFQKLQNLVAVTA